MNAWHRYWFAEGGRYSAAAVRIAIATALMMTLYRVGEFGALPPAPALYHPVGLWLLAGDYVPSAALVTALLAVAWLASAAMLVGLFTRIAAAVAAVTASAIAALVYAPATHWSHEYNVVLLAAVAFIGARGGDAFSLDARFWPRPPQPRGYQWSLRLVQLAGALMFASAAYFKWRGGHFTLRWALSDNLRNQLLVHYDLEGLTRPAFVDWLIADPWRYRTAAIGNLVTQTLPIVACIFVNRPKLRALCGAAFAFETISLGLVVELWNPQWLPLCAVFVDWDALFGEPRAPEPEVAPPRITSAWVAVLAGCLLVTSFHTRFAQRHGVYPFTNYPMFASVLATPPYSGHADWVIRGNHVAAIADVPIPPEVQSELDHGARGFIDVADPAELRARLQILFESSRRQHPELGIHGLRAELAYFVAPAYPAPAGLEMHSIAILGEVAEGGAFRTMRTPYDAAHFEPRPIGVDARSAQLVVYRDRALVAAPLTGPLRLLTGELDVVAMLPDGSAWLVARRRRRHE